MARQYSNTTLETTLSTSIDSSETSIQIGDTTGLPVTFPYSLILDYQTANVEVVTVTGVSGSTVTVTRGQDGTAASAHDTGAVVVHGATARDLAEPQAHIDASAGVHGLEMGSALVGTAMTQTLTNKTIAAADNTLTVALDDLSDVDASGASDNDVLTFDSGTWAPAAPGASAVMQHIADASGTSTLTFSSIPQGFKHLRIFGTVLAGSNDGDLYVRLNNQTGASAYAWGLTMGGIQSTSPTALGDNSDSSITLTPLGGAFALEINLTNYTEFPALVGKTFTGLGDVVLFGGLLLTPAAVTRIDIFGDTDSSTASIVSLYGLS